METLVLKPTQKSIELACELLQSSQVVAIPTETVYGLFANATNQNACEGIFEAKERPMDNPLIVHISDYDMLNMVAKDIPQDALKLAEAFWPGALTIILKKQDIIPSGITAGLNSVGVRMPSNPAILEIIKKSNLPLAGPSANRSGRPSPTNAKYVFEDLKDRIPLIIDGGECNIGVESTVISLVEETPIIFRPGFVTKIQIEEVLGKEVLLSKGICEEINNDEQVLSPGLKHKHYAPKANVSIVTGSVEKINKLAVENNAVVLCFDEYKDKFGVQTVSYGSETDSLSQATKLFSSLRYLDEINATTVYAMMPSLDGVGLAVYNRLIRSAEFKVINL